MGLRTIKSGVAPCRLVYNRGAVTLPLNRFKCRGSVLAIFIVPLEQCTRVYGRGKCLTMPYTHLVAHGYETPALLTQVLAVYKINLYTGAALSPRAYVSSLVMRQKPTRSTVSNRHHTLAVRMYWYGPPLP